VGNTTSSKIMKSFTVLLISCLLFLCNGHSLDANSDSRKPQAGSFHLTIEKLDYRLHMNKEEHVGLKRIFIDAKCASNFSQRKSVNIKLIPRAQLDLGGMVISLENNEWIYFERGTEFDYVWKIQGEFWDEMRSKIENAIELKDTKALELYIKSIK
jgi:hypothetical protein